MKLDWLLVRLLFETTRHLLNKKYFLIAVPFPVTFVDFQILLYGSKGNLLFLQTIEMIEKEQREVERRPITKITHKGEIEIESETPIKEQEEVMEIQVEEKTCQHIAFSS